ncbi:MAG: nickel pincer cofactor biosynthesis protein LarC [Chloroflexota bacterium]
MKIAYFDPFSGASGDMTLGALLDAGLPLEALRSGLARLPVTGWEIRAEASSQHGVSGVRCIVETTDDAASRNWADIRQMLGSSSLEPAVREPALAIFERLANAEAAVHGQPVESVHFHEVGGIDAIVDIVGTCIGLQTLGIEQVYSGPVAAGAGWVRAAHGLLPVPAPATARLLAEAAAPRAAPPSGEPAPPGELLTPTGAAILCQLAAFRRPAFTPSAVGYGFGSRELPWPNALRVWLGETAAEAEGDAELVLETNVDDMNPQFIELLMERLFAAGALDAWITPITMKKGRPAVTVSALCAADQRAAIEDTLIEQSTTLGVRAAPVDRTRAARRFETVTTRWGDVRLKLRGWRGRVIDAAPEYDDCLALARSADVPIREVWNEAHRMGEVFVGRKWPQDRPPTLRVVQ